MSLTLDEALKPSPSLLSKIGSILVHVDEMLSPQGHEIDKFIVDQLLKDAEITDWIKSMGPLLPLKRERSTLQGKESI